MSLPLKIDAWDSKFFRTKIARLDIAKPVSQKLFHDELSEFLSLAKKENVRFLFVRLQDQCKARAKVLLRFKFKDLGETVDLMLARLKIKRFSGSNEYKIRKLKIKDLALVKKISGTAFLLSYLYKCGISKKRKIDLYHEAWVGNLAKDKNTIILVAEKNKNIAGFIALIKEPKTRIGRIKLIALGKKFRGHGIGKQLVYECILGPGKALKTIMVKTQKDNYRAISLYKKSGFRVVKQEKMFCRKIL